MSLVSYLGHSTFSGKVLAFCRGNFAMIFLVLYGKCNVCLIRLLDYYWLVQWILEFKSTSFLVVTKGKFFFWNHDTSMSFSIFRFVESKWNQPSFLLRKSVFQILASVYSQVMSFIIDEKYKIISAIRQATMRIELNSNDYIWNESDYHWAPYTCGFLNNEDSYAILLFFVIVVWFKNCSKNHRYYRYYLYLVNMDKSDTRP